MTDFVSEARAHAERRWLVKCLSSQPIDIDRPQPVLRPGPCGSELPTALSREPCKRCQARGDIGCEHQRPFACAPLPGKTERERPSSRHVYQRRWG